METTGKVVIITAPSGAGKTTIVKHLLRKFDFLSFSVSACTRKKRSGEINGKDYYFLTIKEFEKRIEEDAFLEYEEVYSGSYYGTLKSEVERIWKENKIVVFDIDVKGAVNIKSQLGEAALAIFIKPPSHKELLKRLENRKTEDEESLRKRYERSVLELEYEKKFDEVVVNDNLDLAVKEVERLIENFQNILLD